MFEISASQTRTKSGGGGIAAAWFLLVLAGTWTAYAQVPSIEYQVKASYLYNFTQFIRWPADAFVSTREFNLCVVGAWRFGDALDVLQEERTTGSKVAIRSLRSVRQAPGARCHMLFVADGGAGGAIPTVRGLLTVGETPGFLGRGGIINLVEVHGRIRFEISQKAAQQAGLDVSSQLLRLALNAS